MKRKNEIKQFDTLEEANSYLRKLLYENYKNWTVVNKVIRDKNHKYLICPIGEFDDDFDDCCGYSICLR